MTWRGLLILPPCRLGVRGRERERRGSLPQVLGGAPSARPPGPVEPDVEMSGVVEAKLEFRSRKSGVPRFSVQVWNSHVPQRREGAARQTRLSPWVLPARWIVVFGPYLPMVEPEDSILIIALANLELACCRSGGCCLPAS